MKTYLEIKEERRARWDEKQRAAEAEKERLLEIEADERERRYLRNLSRGQLTRTTGDEREPWL